MPERSVAGKSIVTRRAIVDIVRIAVQGSYGVTGFSDPSFGRRLLRWIGLDRPGIRLTTDDGVSLDVFITVALGVPVAEVARQVDSAVRYSLRQYVGAEVASLSIHVDGLRYQPNAVERAEAIERAETIELSDSSPEQPPVEAGDREAVVRSAAEGGTAARKRKAK
ncbi:MAG: Asp23/Gls24 family envelope stress response protein [Candidatus Limnocylindrales bacterium]